MPDLGSIPVSYDDLVATLIFSAPSSSNSIYINNNSVYPSTFIVPINTNATLIVNKVGYQVSCYSSSDNNNINISENTFFYTKGTYSIVNNNTNNNIAFTVQSVRPFYDTSGSINTYIDTSGYNTTGITIGSVWNIQANSPIDTSGGYVITSNNNVISNSYYNTVNNTQGWRSFTINTVINPSISYNGTCILGVTDVSGYTININSTPSNLDSFSSWTLTNAAGTPTSSAIQYTPDFFVVMLGFSAGLVLYGTFNTQPGIEITLNSVTIGSGNTFVSMSASSEYQLIATSDGYINYIDPITYTSTASNIQATPNVFTSICMSALSQYAVASTSNAGCFISKDYGVNWAALTSLASASTPNVNFSSISISYNGQNIIATGNTGATYYTYYSSDYGVTFTASKNAGNFISSCMSPTGLYAVAYGVTRGVYLSYN